MFSDSLSSLSKISSVQDIDFGDISGAFCINFSSDDQYFAVGCGNGSIQVKSDRCLFFSLRPIRALENMRRRLRVHIQHLPRPSD